MTRVEPVVPADYEAVLPLVAGYQRFYGVKEPNEARNREFFRRFLDPSDHGSLLGAYEDTGLVGFACLQWTFSSINAAEVVLLADLFVAPSARGRGVGRSLIDAAVRVATQRGARHLEWLTHIDNREAQRLYEKVGAERSAWFGYEILVGGRAT